MTKLVDLNAVRASWTARYGSARATAMLSGAHGGMAYDARGGLRRYGRDASGMDPDDTGASGGGDDPDSRMEAIKTFLKNRLDPEVVVATVQNDGVCGRRPSRQRPNDIGTART